MQLLGFTWTDLCPPFVPGLALYIPQVHRFFIAREGSIPLLETSYNNNHYTMSDSKEKNKNRKSKNSFTFLWYKTQR